MRYRDHIVFATGTSCIWILPASYVTAHGFTFLALVCAATGLVLGSIVPDIDHPNSYFNTGLRSRLLASAFFVGFALTIYLSAAQGRAFGNAVYIGTITTIAIIVGIVALSVLSYLAHHYFGHRGIVHSITFLLPVVSLTIILSLVFHLSPLLPIATFWGILFHLVGDTFTGNGVPLFWPFYEKKVMLASSIKRQTVLVKVLVDISIILTLVMILFTRVNSSALFTLTRSFLLDPIQ